MPLHPRALLAGAAALALAGGVTWWWQIHRSAPATSSNPQSAIANPQSPLPLHPVVRQIVEEGPLMPYLKLNYVLKELSTSLTEQDIDALLVFITGPKPPAFGDVEWGSITNDIQEALSVQVVPNEKVAKAFIAVARDESRSQLMRDYALQHIGGFAIYLVHTRDTRGGQLPEFFDSLVNELKSAAADASKPWCGTSLNLLDGLLRAAEYRATDLKNVTPDGLIALALPVAENPQAPLNARLPALQLASRRGSPAALDLARRILADPESHLMLVQSACAVLGEQGGPNDIAALESLIAKNKPRRATAARAALNRLTTGSSPH
jgi:hypothetical protein